MLSRFIKALVDRLLSAIALIMLSPFILVLAIAIYFNMGSPVIFSQPRGGKNNTVFTFYKFRTMIGSPQRTCYATEERHRITAFGRFLRAFHIDEMPQIFNILKGDMAWVGPRPEQPEIYAHLATVLPCYRMRSLSKPGLLSTVQSQAGYVSTTRAQLRRLWCDRQDTDLRGCGHGFGLLRKTLVYLLSPVK